LHVSVTQTLGLHMICDINDQVDVENETKRDFANRVVKVP